MDRLLLLLLLLLVIFFIFLPNPSTSQSFVTKSFDTFDASDTNLIVVPNAAIANGALQLTPDSANSNFLLTHYSGRVLLKRPFKLFNNRTGIVASFNSSFFVNIGRSNNSNSHGEGLTFLIAPNLDIPVNSSGQYLGLTNASTDGLATNQIVAIEFDTFKEGFDPDNNHIGLNINSVVSNVTVSIANYGLELSPNGTEYFHVWVQYNGTSKIINVYMVNEDTKSLTKAMPQSPVMSAYLDISRFVAEYSYFGFSASTGDAVELNCILRWNLTVQDLSGGSNTAFIVWVAGGSAAVAAIVLLGWCIYKGRRKNNDPKILGTLKSLPDTPREFEFSEIKKATNNFDEKRNKLGQGGFGVVYKGELTKENSVIAVKKFSRDNIKGKDDFLAELTIINRLRHKHLVKLLGWCHKNGMLLLVYECMPNGSLDKQLFGGPNKEVLGWNLRYKIVSGVSSALHYLHNEYDQKVLHRDLKASNIMLDSDYNARLGDFGLARVIDNEMTSYATLEGIAGTPGYIAPECLLTGKASLESDVYGFGAVVLEVVCGRQPWTKVGQFNYLVEWVWSLHRDGRIVEAVDERLGSDYSVEQVKRLLLLGLACTHPIADERPKTQLIVQIISGAVPAPVVPLFRPAFMWPAMSPTTDGGDSVALTMMTSGSNSAIRHGRQGTASTGIITHDFIV